MNKLWYGRLKYLAYPLLPFAFLFQLIVTCRRRLYQSGFLKSTKVSVPVIVVGNLTVGGTGKTPFVIWLAGLLKKNNYRVGIVSRGYKAKISQPILIDASHHAAQVGDEPFLIYKRTQCPVVVCPNRVNAVKKLLAETDCDIIISDDGLQHYALSRDVEIMMIDGQRRFGNQYCLPAGPLREPMQRLASVDYRIANGGEVHDGEVAMQLTHTNEFIQVNDATKTASIEDLHAASLHALAGIANPDRFFKTLQGMGLSFKRHAFSDHYVFKKKDIDRGKNIKVVMTEKDAVKCEAIADDEHYYLPVDAVLPSFFIDKLLKQIKTLTERS